MVRKQACKIDCIFSVVCLMTTIIADLKSSRKVLDQNDIVSRVYVVVRRVRDDRKSMMVYGRKDAASSGVGDDACCCSSCLLVVTVFCCME